MLSREQRNRQYLTNLFAGPFPGHALLVLPPTPPRGDLGDYSLSDRPVSDWLPLYVQEYQDKVKWLEILDDDSVPYVNLITHTGLFAAAFGCPIHIYHGMDTNPASRPVVFSSAEADRLTQPTLDSPMIQRFFELARQVKRELGPEVPISVPDIQSPFDIAALIWEKQSFYTALMDAPDAVHRLVEKTHKLLKEFLLAFKTEFPNPNLAHYPSTWAPKELGCWLSEDEVGALSPKMFVEFCLPTLVDLSQTFGGLFMHCCAYADHKYEGFLKIPNLRGLNRNFYDFSPQRCIELFSRKTVLMLAGTSEQKLNELLDLALPETRYLFTLEGLDLEQARPVYERLRKRMPRL